MLQTIIAAKIRQDGPIPFRDFMDMALYHPEFGYYTGKRDKIGLQGDYYTSSSLTPAFGAAIARQLEEMWRLCGEKKFTVVEYGAGTGTLCHDILKHLSENQRMYESLSYCIIEKSQDMRTRAQAYLPKEVNWHNNIEDIGTFTGCVLSNELLDNFPVHRVIMLEELMEIFLTHSDGFTEVMRPAGPELKKYFEDLHVTLPYGFQTEVNLDAKHWIKSIAAHMEKGFVLTIDYGFTSDELYREARRSGTLMCYTKHTINDTLYTDIGCQDITAHVNFSALCHWGDTFGLTCSGLTTQANFLLNLGFKQLLEKHHPASTNIIEAAKKLNFLSHTLLVEMGRKFKVLIQQKKIPATALTGLG